MSYWSDLVDFHVVLICHGKDDDQKEGSAKQLVEDKGHYWDILIGRIWREYTYKERMNLFVSNEKSLTTLMFK